MPVDENGVYRAYSNEELIEFPRINYSNYQRISNSNNEFSREELMPVQGYYTVTSENTASPKLKDIKTTGLFKKSNKISKLTQFCKNTYKDYKGV